MPYIDPTLKPRTSLEEKIIQRARADALAVLARLRADGADAEIITTGTHRDPSTPRRPAS